MYIIGFNGPPRSGKDTIAQNLAARLWARGYEEPQISHLSIPMRRTVYELLGADYHINHYEACKDEPQELFGGKTIREAMIALSESHVKPLYGKDFWAKRMVRGVGFHSKLLLIPDIGFLDEIEYLVVKERATMLLVHTYRAGYGWNNDSRSYVMHDNCLVLPLFNDVNGLRALNSMSDKIIDCVLAEGWAL